jgi:hypothetical protein
MFDFYQLPPVPDINYGDNGQMCYNSLYVKKFFHHVQLDMGMFLPPPPFFCGRNIYFGMNNLLLDIVTCLTDLGNDWRKVRGRQETNIFHLVLLLTFMKR